MKLKKNIALSDSGFLFNPSTGDSYSVNPIGMDIIRQLQQGTADDKIIDHITKQYMIDKASVEKDLYDFKIMLGNYKLAE